MAQLTRDYILKMEAGLEMDELIIVNVFGYEKLPLPAIPKFQKPTPDGVDGLYFVNHYSEDIRAAWEVVEELILRGETINLKYEKEFTGKGMAWYLYTKSGAGWSYDSFSETAPLAICRAALLAVMEK